MQQILLVKSQPNCLPYGYVCCCFPSPKAPQRALLFNQTTVHKAWPFSRARLNPLISAIIPSTALPMNMGRRKQTLETRPHQSDFPTKDKPRFGAIPLQALLCYYWHEHHKIAQKALLKHCTALKKRCTWFIGHRPTNIAREPRTWRTWPSCEPVLNQFHKPKSKWRSRMPLVKAHCESFQTTTCFQQNAWKLGWWWNETDLCASHPIILFSWPSRHPFFRNLVAMTWNHEILSPKRNK